MKTSNSSKSIYISLGGAGVCIMEDFDDDLFPLEHQLHIETDRGVLKCNGKGKKLLIGEKNVRGLGCSKYPELGKQSVKESLLKILATIKNKDDAFIIAGVGGGTGGAAPYLAKQLINNGKNVHLILSLWSIADSEFRMKTIEGTLSEAEEIEKKLSSLTIMEFDSSRYDKKATVRDCMLQFHGEIASGMLAVK